MQKIIFKRSIPFRTETGTIVSDTIIAENGNIDSDNVINIVAIVDGSNSLVSHRSKCVFNKNKIMHSEHFNDQDLKV